MLTFFTLIATIATVYGCNNDGSNKHVACWSRIGDRYELVDLDSEDNSSTACFMTKNDTISMCPPFSVQDRIGVANNDTLLIMPNPFKYEMDNYSHNISDKHLINFKSEFDISDIGYTEIERKN